MYLNLELFVVLALYIVKIFVRIEAVVADNLYETYRNVRAVVCNSLVVGYEALPI